MKRFCSLLCAWELAAAVASGAADVRPTHLRCEYRQDPIGIDVVQPRLSWALEAAPTGDNFVFALARLQIPKGETDLADGAKVLTLDSIESGAWAKVNLTGGVAARTAKQNAEIEKRRADLLQAWHRYRQEPYDPLAAAQLALGGFMQCASSRLPGAEGYYRPNFGSMMLPKAICAHAQWDCGDCTARALLAWKGVKP